jgi:hypothetical protein
MQVREIAPVFSHSLDLKQKLHLPPCQELPPMSMSTSQLDYLFFGNSGNFVDVEDMIGIFSRSGKISFVSPADGLRR